MKPLNIIFLIVSIFCTTDQQALAQLAAAEGYNLDAVARVARYKGGRFLGYCSGTLIKKNIILTAKHCLEKSDTLPFVILGSNNHEVIKVKSFHTQDGNINNMFNSTGELSEKYLQNFLSTVPLDGLILILDSDSSHEPIRIIPTEFIEIIDLIAFKAVGYPGRAPILTDSNLGFQVPLAQMSADFCNLTSFQLEKGFLRTNCFASGGMSGGPILTKIKNTTYIVSMTSISNTHAEGIQGYEGDRFVGTAGLNILNSEIFNWLNNY